jgi:hypothetical protein
LSSSSCTCGCWHWCLCRCIDTVPRRQQTPGAVAVCRPLSLPCLPPQQDTPAVKSSYSAAVRVPAGLTALMSAVPTQGPPVLPDGSTAAEGVPHLDGDAPAAGSSGSSSSSVFYFNQKVCIPSYLIALAVGELEKRELSDRCVKAGGISSLLVVQPGVADTATTLCLGLAVLGARRLSCATRSGRLKAAMPRCHQRRLCYGMPLLLLCCGCPQVVCMERAVCC